MNGVRGRGNHPWTTCARCGARWQRDGGNKRYKWLTCADCRSVLRMLGEIHKWENPDCPDLQDERVYPNLRRQVS